MILLTHNALEAGPHYTTSVIVNDLRKVSVAKAKKVSTKAKFRLESCVRFQKKKIRFRWSLWRFFAENCYEYESQCWNSRVNWVRPRIY